MRLASKPVPFVVSPKTPTPFAVARPYTGRAVSSGLTLHADAGETRCNRARGPTTTPIRADPGTTLAKPVPPSGDASRPRT